MVLRGAVGIRVGREHRIFPKLPHERSAEVRARLHRQRAVGKPVVPAAEGEHAGLPGSKGRRLERSLDRFGTRAGQNALAQVARRHAGKLAQQRHLHIWRMHVAHPVQQPPRLRADRLHDTRVRVPCPGHRECSRQVHVGVAVHIAHVGAPGFGPEHREVRCQIRDTGRLVAGELRSEPEGFRSGRRDANVGKSLAEGGGCSSLGQVGGAHTAGAMAAGAINALSRDGNRPHGREEQFKVADPHEPSASIRSLMIQVPISVRIIPTL